MPHETHFEVPSVFWIIAFIAITMPISGVCLDIYVPSLPNIQRFFGVHKDLVQLTVGMFILGNAATQLVFGILSDVHGRRKIILCGAFFFAFSAFLATTATSIYFLLFVRFCEGIAVAMCTAGTRALAPDVFKGASYKKVISLMTVAWAIGPIIAPFLGGYLQHYFNWHAPFYFLTGYGFLLFALAILVLPETNRHPSPVDMRTLSQQLLATLKHPVFVGGSLIGGLTYSLIVVFNVMGPFLIQNALGKTAVFYGYMALILGLAWFLGSSLNRVLVNQPVRIKMPVLMSIILLFSVVMLILAVNTHLSILTIVLPIFVIFVCGGATFPNAIGKPLQLFPAFTGFASSFSGSFLFMVAFIMTAIASLFHATSLLPIASLYVIIILLIWLIYFTLFNRKQ